MKLSKMKKDDIELLSYTNIAKLYLEENKITMTTADLFKEVCKLLELSDSEYQDKIADFFQSLTTSKEFILLEDGKWDLKSNHKVKIVMDDLYEEKDEDDEDIHHRLCGVHGLAGVAEYACSATFYMGTHLCAY